jgi:Transposase
LRASTLGENALDLPPTRATLSACGSSGIGVRCTSLLEGINNNIKVIQRMAYGFRDDHYFFLKIRAGFPGNA